jgi:hypothetical protein
MLIQLSIHSDRNTGYLLACKTVLNDTVEFDY